MIGTGTVALPVMKEVKQETKRLRPCFAILSLVCAPLGATITAAPIPFHFVSSFLTAAQATRWAISSRRGSSLYSCQA